MFGVTTPENIFDVSTGAGGVIGLFGIVTGADAASGVRLSPTLGTAGLFVGVEGMGLALAKREAMPPDAPPDEDGVCAGAGPDGPPFIGVADESKSAIDIIFN